MPADNVSFYSKTRNASKIIVVDLGFLGDTVHLLPSLWELKRNYPDAALHVMTSPLGCEVLGMAACVEHCWPVEMSRQKRTFRQQRQVIAAVRAEGFDVAFNFSAADRPLIMTWMTGAKRRISYAGGRPHFWKKWLMTDWMEPRLPTNPVFERRRQMLASCGLVLGAVRFGLEPSQADKNWAAQTVPQGAFHFSLNASTPLKEWPVEHWIKLARLMWAARPEIRIVATTRNQPRERARLDAFANTLKGNRLETFMDLTIPRLTALIQGCALHVGQDSGVLHIATASDVSSVSLFRDSAGVAGWLPQGEKHVSLVVNCPCLQQQSSDCSSKVNPVCLANLFPEDVMESIPIQNK